MNFKNNRRDENCAMAETKLAGEFLERTIDHYDDLPEDLRVIVIVASGDGDGKLGCAFEGYDSDERLALDLQMLSQAVDLGEPPVVRLITWDSLLDQRNAARADLDGSRAELRREQDARARLRVEIDRTIVERDDARAEWQGAAGRAEAMERERDTYRAMLCDVIASAHPNERDNPAMSKQWKRATELLKNGVPIDYDLEATAEPCCPQSTLPGSTHDVGCRGGGKVH